MNRKLLATTLFFAATTIVAPSVAQTPPAPTPTPSNQVINACVQNRAETLPIPFSDISPNHWAFKAVMTMYYCGAFRQATPPRLVEQLQRRQTQNNQQSKINNRPFI